MTAARTFCRICQAYCGLVVDVDDEDGVIQSVRADRDHPVSRGYTCTKGRAIGEIQTASARLLGPRLRGTGAGWDETLADLAATISQAIEAHGPEAVAVFRGTGSYFDSAGVTAVGRLVSHLGTPQLYTTSTIDQVARFWVAQQMCGLHHVLPLVDEERTLMTILVGTNPPASHGHVSSWPDPVQRLRHLSANGSLWCLDVRETEASAVADNHVMPRPGTDWAVLGHVVREILKSGADAEFLAGWTHGVDELRRAAEPLDRSRAAAIAGLWEDDLLALVSDVRANRRLAVQTGTGTTMSRHGDVTEWMAWALMAVTGSFDREGGVWFNPGYFASQGARRPAPADEPGPASRDLLGRFGERPTAALVDEIEAGTVKVLIVSGGNPLRAVPGARRLGEAFERLDALAVLDVLETATVEAATHVLACATHLERSDVSIVQSMYPLRGVQYTPALCSPAGDTRLMFDIVSDLTQRLGGEPLAADSEALFGAMAGDEAEELRERRLLTADPVYGWFTDELLPDAGWNLAPAPLVERLAGLLEAMPEPASLVLTPRRQVGHMNTLLSGRTDTPNLLVHPDDASAAGLESGDEALVTTGSGELTATVRTDPGIRPGAVSMPHGFDQPNIADLTTDTDDVHPIYGMPVLSGVPVEIRPAFHEPNDQPR